MIACGDRNWKDEALVYATLTALRAETEDGFLVIEGKARGADTLAWLWATTSNDPSIYHQRVPADWEKLGKAAGVLRNQRMLNMLLRLRDDGADVLVVAFHDDIDSSKGTGDMVKRARAAGVEVHVVSHAANAP